MFDYDLAVIGAGGAGVMAHLRAVLNRDRSILFQGDADTKRRGRATWVEEVDNIPGMHGLKKPITATAKSTLKWIEQQDQLKDYQQLVKGKVTQIEPLETGFRLHYATRKSEDTVRARYVVLATGIMDVQPHIQGSIQPILPYANAGHALYCLRCDGHRTLGHKLSVLGPINTAVQIAALMQERYGHETVSLLTHGDNSEISADNARLMQAYGMTAYNSPIVEILGDPTTALEGFRLEDGQEVATSNVIVALGSIIYNELLTAIGGKVDEKGRVLVNEKYESSVPDLFVVGDLVSGSKMQIYTAWEEAVIAAEEINRRLRAIRRAERLASVT